jgi:hypothetical protein
MRATDTLMELSYSTFTPTPQVIENYRDFKPPVQLQLQVEQLLRAVPIKYLAGLKTVLLTNRSALTRDQRRQSLRAKMQIAI